MTHSKLAGIDLDVDTLSIVGIHNSTHALSNNMYCYHIYNLTGNTVICPYGNMRPLLHSRWVKDVMLHIKLEKIKYTFKGSVQKSHKA